MQNERQQDKSCAYHHDCRRITPRNIFLTDMFYTLCQLSIRSVSFENIARIDFVLHVVQHGIIAIGNDGLAAGFEGSQVVDYL